MSKELTLEMVGYWASLDTDDEGPPGLPDPRGLVGRCGIVESRQLAKYLESGVVIRSYMGSAACRICGADVGNKELTDGRWAWPSGLAHYVREHHVPLPEGLMAAANGDGPPRPSGLEARFEKPQLVASGVAIGRPAGWEGVRVSFEAWFEWAAQAIPAQPAADAVTTEEAIEVADALSHDRASFNLEDAYGRWRVVGRVHGRRVRFYLERSSSDALRERLLRIRPPDPDNLLSMDAANEIAGRHKFPDREVRVLAAHEQAGLWLVWVKPDGAEWPDDAISAHGNMQPGFEASHPDGSRSRMCAMQDALSWEHMLTHEIGRAEPQGFGARLGAILAKQAGKSVQTCG